MSAKQPILLEHQICVVHFICARGKVAVPEKRHSLEQRISGGEHDIHPPSGKLLWVAGRQNCSRQFITLLAEAYLLVGTPNESLNNGRRMLFHRRIELRRGAGECGTPIEVSSQR